MATATRPYLVENNTGAKRLVMAGNQSQARNFVTKSEYGVKLVNASEVIKLLAAGMQVEDASADPVEPTEEPGAEQGPAVGAGESE